MHFIFQSIRGMLVIDMNPRYRVVLSFFDFVLYITLVERLLNSLLYMQTDRASMLDEIIEYVKLLQTQIKVLPQSLARLNFCSLL